MNDISVASVREALAEYAHEAWSGWMKYMFEKGSFTTTWDIYERRKVQTFHLPHQFVERWRRQMNTPYAYLPESEKESDRQEADKMLAIVADLQSLLAAYAQRVIDQDTEIAMLRQREEMR